MTFLSKIKKNSGLIFGLVASIWIAALNIVLVPIYLKLLGSDSYGLVGIYTTLQTIILFFDLGLSSTIGREIAKANNQTELDEAKHVLQFGSFVYIIFSSIIFFTFLLFSTYLSSSWIKSDILTPNQIRESVIAIGLLIAVRWPISLYQNVLNSKKKMLEVSTVNIIFTSLSGVGYVLIFSKVFPGITSFFIWFTLFGLVHALVLNRLAWMSIGASKKFNLIQTFNSFKKNWSYTKDLAFIGFLGLILSQMDKLMLSSFLSLSDFSLYMVASTLMGSLYLIIMPVYNYIFPHFSKLSNSGEKNEFIENYFLSSGLFSAFLYPIVAFMIVYMNEILTVWLKNPVLTNQIQPIAILLIIGTGLHGIMYFPYAVTLSSGHSSVALKIAFIMSLISIPLMYLLIKTNGAFGAASAWVVLQLMYVIGGTIYSHKKINLGSPYEWLAKSVLLPIAISLICLPIYIFLKSITSNLYILFTVGILQILLTILILIFIRRDIKNYFWNNLILNT